MKKEDLIIRKSFSISHNNGSIWAENLDALYEFEDIVENKFLEDMKTINRPSSPSSIAINLNETIITEHLAAVIVENLNNAGPRVRKVAVVGLEKKNLHIMKKIFKKHNISFAYQFFDDFMKAKDWLI